jgi:hypothetical protein
MIRASVYYSPEANQIVLMTPIYALNEQVTFKIEYPEHEDTVAEYELIGLACDNNELIIVLAPAALKYFEYIGEL